MNNITTIIYLIILAIIQAVLANHYYKKNNYDNAIMYATIAGILIGMSITLALHSYL